MSISRIKYLERRIRKINGRRAQGHLTDPHVLRRLEFELTEAQRNWRSRHVNGQFREDDAGEHWKIQRNAHRGGDYWIVIPRSAGAAA